MYPVLFRIGDLEITSFGALVALGAVVGLWVFRREIQARGLPAALIDAGLWALLGGIVGAKLLYTIEHLGEAPALALLASRGGMSWFGGFVGGVGTGLVLLWWRGWPLVPALAAASPALAFGQALGRIGCFLVGDDYGRPTNLPWGVAFPQGIPPTTVPVHPAQLYEAAFLAVLGWLLIRWRRGGVADRLILAGYLVLAGAFRFGLEFVRVNERVLAGLTTAQLVSAALVAAGAWLLSSRRS